jgi:hypothetical protein
VTKDAWSSPNDTVRSVEGDPAILEVKLNKTFGVGLDVSEVTYVPHFVFGGPMSCVLWIEVRASSGATSTQVARLTKGTSLQLASKIKGPP